MKRLLLAAALAAATGCTTPGQMIEDTEPIAATLAQPPAAAALCITRNIERRAANIITDRRATAASVELVARVTGNVTTTYAVVHLDPAGTGSAAKIWLAPHMFSGAESVARDLMEGC